MKQTDRFQPSQSDEGRYRLLIEAVTDYAIYMLDPSGIVSSWNPGAKRFKGYEESEIVGQHFSVFYTEEDRARGLPARALALARDKGSFQIEGWRVRKDGTRFWASVVIDPIRSANGELQGFAKVTRDLTERKEAERALRASEEQFRILVQGVTDYAIYLLDPAGRIDSWNPGAQRIKGYSPEEIIGKHFSVFYTDADRKDGAPERALEIARREGRFEREGLRLRKDGTSFTAHVIIDPIHDDDGTLLGFAKVTRDITERKQTQAELEKAREALFQSQKMDAIGQLTGGVAHDFNNLLMAILGSLELASKRLPDDPQLKRLIDNAIQGGQRGAALTQRMLAFARRQSLKPQIVDVAGIVGGIADMLQRSISPNVQIETHMAAGLPPVKADTNQLELALLNLATNARDAMPLGGKIIISAHELQIGAGNENHLAPGRYVCIKLKDFGEGMDKETLARAIEPFFTTKGVGKGTGLGLPMVHGMAAQMGGAFMLESEKGKGTTAAICLPAVANHAVMAAEPVMKNVPARTRPLVVVAVDDDSLVLLNTTAMLEDMGHTVLEAHSAETALALLRENNVDLVITDQAMPQMTGLQLYRRIKSEWPGLPVIIATGYAELPAGSPHDLAILTKPFNEQELAAQVAGVTRPLAQSPA